MVKRHVVDYLISHHGLPIRRACRLVGQHRSVQYYESVRDPESALRQRLREFAQIHVRYGYRRLHVLLRREGWKGSRNKLYRLYADEKLQLRGKLPKRRKSVVTRRERFTPSAPGQAWEMNSSATAWPMEQSTAC
jgi:putative transposase